jgi:hypothetical protein
MRSVGLFSLIMSAFLLAACVHPQIVGSYEALRARLKPGDGVELIASAGRVSGTVETMTADSIVVISEGSRREFLRGDVSRVEKIDRPWRRSAVKGLLIGGGTGAAIAAFSDCRAGEISCGGMRVGGAAGSALIGLGIGAVAGARPRATIIYVARSAPAK